MRVWVYERMGFIEFIECEIYLPPFSIGWSSLLQIRVYILNINDLGATIEEVENEK